MHCDQFIEATHSLFGDLLTSFDEGEEYAFYNFGPQMIYRIGFSTNITPDIVRQAAANKIDLIVTHHDAWDFVFGMKEECHNLLKQFQISHYFVHLPLDYADFGTCNSLFQALKVNQIIQTSYHNEGRSMPGVGIFKEPLTFEALNERVTNVLKESVKSWKNSEKRISKVGIITGAGNSTNNILDALKLGCDAYLTGEKTLYSVQYAQYVGMNMIVGSHTFTEIFGVRSLVEQIRIKFNHLEIIELSEEHFE
ncbi:MULTISPECIES: Nif3-like dinuclear metal center hexameric protein [unclassified Paenibacillus]|uniref:Nif3-like dinuclear metal center hexameric protein n=1 Tax=unclassified Paenibacillus TaxID=185978 RepID=UPI00070E5DB5|nr:MULTISPECIES: Nif3-like dinuclear metal center hexameric protein [unclassified Paenibacillus]KQX65907.1 SMS protein [Paenibacillus sp. Root444D2]KRE48876.1 SMS protein [Paenibacillus sp. Soil724D2]